MSMNDGLCMNRIKTHALSRHVSTNAFAVSFGGSSVTSEMFSGGDWDDECGESCVSSFVAFGMGQAAAFNLTSPKRPPN
jgi:hypothetical protein